MLDKVWDLLILYTEHYERFCSHIFSSLVDDLSLSRGSDPYTSTPITPYIFLDKPTSLTSQELLTSYLSLYFELKAHSDLLYPWWQVWPSYPTHDSIHRETILSV
jgi:hypothetical protein